MANYRGRRESPKAEQPVAPVEAPIVENDKKAEESVSGEVSLHNKGNRVFITKSGKLNPNSSIVVSEKEAEILLKYPEILKTGDMPARDGRSVSQLKAENEKLKAELEKAKARE
jgi:hypothetical protein